MKKLSALALTLACIGAAPAAHAATQIAVNIGINAPGQYGRIDFNNDPQAVLITQQPLTFANAKNASTARAPSPRTATTTTTAVKAARTTTGSAPAQISRSGGPRDLT